MSAFTLNLVLLYDFEKLLGHKYISPEQFLKPLGKLISVYVSKRTGRKENTSLENTLIITVNRIGDSDMKTVFNVWV